MIWDVSLACLGYTDTMITDGGPTLDLKSYTQIDLLSTSARLRYLDAKGKSNTYNGTLCS